MIDRQVVFEACKADLDSRHKRLREEIGELQAANADNTKSTAGDKHETSRAMVHLELEKLGNQLALVEQMQIDLVKANMLELEGGSIRFGSIIQTSKGIFLLGVPCGKFSDGNISVFGLGMQSPLAKAMIGANNGATIELHGNSFTVQSVF